MKKGQLFSICLLLMVSLLVQTPVQAAKAKSKKKKVVQPPPAVTPAPSTPVATRVPAQPPVSRNHGIPREKLSVAYDYGRALYTAKQFEKAKDVFKKIALVATDPDLSANSLYLFSQCALRSEDYTGTVKSLTILAKKWPSSSLVKGGYVSRFCYFLINQVSNLQTHWDYYRFKERTGADGEPVWKESVPPGFKIKRINFKLGFGLLRVLKIIEPTAPKTLECQQKLATMLGRPITMLWVDEKAPPDHWGHPVDFLSIFSTNEKKDFSRVICQRMFFDWETEKFYQFVYMHDDVRNLKPRFIAETPVPEETSVAAPTAAGGTASSDAPPLLTLKNLFAVAGYNPYEDSFTNLIESTPADLAL